MTDFKDFCPERLYLMDGGDDIVWCEDPAPSVGMTEDDSVGYVRADVVQGLKAQWQAEALEEVARSVLADDPYKGEGADITANISVRALRFEAEALRRKQRTTERSTNA